MYKTQNGSGFIHSGEELLHNNYNSDQLETLNGGLHNHTSDGHNHHDGLNNT
jgi:hypothetical protein